jgi:glycosyltransferase involved in cell wall biosynthesis
VLLVENRDRFLKGTGNRGREWADHQPSGYTVSEIPTFRVARGERIYYLARKLSALHRARPEAVVLGGWESPAYWQALAWCKRHRIRTVGFYESTQTTHRHRSGLIALSRRWFFRRLDAVVVPGVAARDAILAMGVEANKIHVGFNAVDVQRIHDETARQRSSTPVRSDAGHRYLYLGQLIARKNVQSLIEAFSAIRRTDDVLTLAGAGECEEALRSLVTRLGLTESVQFVGLVAYKHVPSLFARYHTLVLPSTEEVWGLVANEALAGGLHVVVSEACGVAPSIHGMDGVFQAATDAATLAEAMERSRTSWHGPITNPQILEMTPTRFADVFVSAVMGG